LTHRGPENLLRFAVQLCVLKKHGRFLADYGRVPPTVLGYLCRQVELEPRVALAGRARDILNSGISLDFFATPGLIDFSLF
jgi:Domain of unknown function (DUF4158)